MLLCVSPMLRTVPTPQSLPRQLLPLPPKPGYMFSPLWSLQSARQCLLLLSLCSMSTWFRLYFSAGCFRECLLWAVKLSTAGTIIDLSPDSVSSIRPGIVTSQKMAAGSIKNFLFRNFPPTSNSSLRLHPVSLALPWSLRPHFSRR